MTTATIQSCTLRGIEAVPVEVKVELVKRLPSIVIVGLPAHTSREVGDRVRSAIVSSGFEFPRLRVVVELLVDGQQTGSESGAIRSASGLDLPIAVAILVASGQIKADALPDTALLFGELSLSGDVRPVRGSIAASILANGGLVTAPGSPIARPSCVLWNLAKLLGLEHYDDLDHVAAMPLGPDLRTAARVVTQGVWGDRYDAQIQQALASRRPILLVGEPGSGCTLLARRIQDMLPVLDREAAEEVAAIHDAAGLAPEHLHGTPPLRAPHHTVSASGLVGGATLRPGEATLAHRGVLLLEEVTEFSRQALDMLAQVVKAKEVRIGRSGGVVRMPADFQLVAITRPTDDERVLERLRHPLLKDAVRIEVTRE